jgi:hypothetical protein
MNVGVCKVRLHLPENHSLKDKRRMLSSIVTRVKSNYNVSIAEVGDQDVWQSAILGVVCVSNSAHQTSEILLKVVNFIRQSKFAIEMLDYEIEIVPSL